MCFNLKFLSVFVSPDDFRSGIHSVHAHLQKVWEELRNNFDFNNDGKIEPLEFLGYFVLVALYRTQVGHTAQLLVCKCGYIHTCIYIHTLTYTWIHTVHAYSFIHTYTYILTYVLIKRKLSFDNPSYIYTYSLNNDKLIQTFKSIQYLHELFTCNLQHTYLHTYIHIYIHPYIHFFHSFPRFLFKIILVHF